MNTKTKASSFVLFVIVLLSLLSSGCKSRAASDPNPIWTAFEATKTATSRPPAGPPRGRSRIRAVALGVLQQHLKQNQGGLPRQLKEFGGLKKVMGYVVDENRKEIIVFGTTDDTSSPSLFLEDFVVALRNEWLKYADLRGNTYIYSYPGCSIDPAPETIEKLNQVGQAVNATSNYNEVEKQLQKWHETCRDWQTVRVLGVPFNTRFAWATVQADYDMKVLVDGSDSLDIPGFRSLTELKLDLARASILKQRQLEVSLTGMNRFWFFPARNRYEEGNNAVWIRDCAVTLLTEQNALSRQGSYVPTGNADPLAGRFVQDFSNIYQKVAEQRPIYSDLENLFRFVALAKILHFKSTDDEAKWDLRYLLEEFSVQETSVEQRLRGRSAVKEFKHRQDLPNGYQEYRLWLPSCGGVDIRIDVNQNVFTRSAPALDRVTSAILDARPSPDALYWDLPMSNDAASEFLRAARLSEVKGRSELRTIVEVDYDGSAYYMVTDQGRLRVGERVSILMAKLSELEGLSKRMLIVKVAGFNDEQLKFFRTACYLERDKMRLEPFLIIVNANAEESAILDAVVSPGASLEVKALNVPLQAAGAITASIPFSVRWKGKNEKYNVEISCDDTDTVAALIQNLVNRFAPHNFQSESLIDSISSATSEIVNKSRIKNKNIQIRIRTESGVIQTGAVLRGSKSRPV